MLNMIVFYGLAVTVLGAALCVVLMRNVVHSALFLGLSLAGVAGLFATLNADFLMGAQILIYVSGIAVLVLFAVMLAGRASDLLLRQVNEQWLAALVLCGVLFYVIVRIFVPYRLLGVSGGMKPTTAALGQLLLGDLAFPFELVSIILMVALAGVVYFSKGDTTAMESNGKQRRAGES